MSTYQVCDGRVVETARRLRQQYHKALDAADVTISYLFAYAPRDRDGNKKGYAIMHNGYPAKGLIRVNSLKLRVQGLADLTMELDGDDWTDTPDDEKIAIIDHELTHIEVHELRRHPQTGKVTYEEDDIGRPVTTLKKHDIMVGGFKSMIARHGKASVEGRHVIAATLSMQEAIGFDPVPEVKRELAINPDIKFRDAVRNAIDLGTITRDSVAASVLREPRRPASPPQAAAVMKQVADQINAGALGPGVTATAQPAHGSGPLSAEQVEKFQRMQAEQQASHERVDGIVKEAAQAGNPAAIAEAVAAEAAKPRAEDQIRTDQAKKPRRRHAPKLHEPEPEENDDER